MPTNVNTRLTALIAIITTGLHPELTSEYERREDACKVDLTRCMIFYSVDSTKRFTVFFSCRGLVDVSVHVPVCYRSDFLRCWGKSPHPCDNYRENRILYKEYRTPDVMILVRRKVQIHKCKGKHFILHPDSRLTSLRCTHTLSHPFPFKGFADSINRDFEVFL